NNTSTSGVRSSSFISGSLGLGEFIEYIVKQLFNICRWIMRSYIITPNNSIEDSDHPFLVVIVKNHYVIVI
ncbi:hypothetical protein, partial [Bathymodiolus heckerae thiotrophic gill symbiont]|uniref:hypothetical protein n=1 Tax=Bathymodiolus heckerae thiotrophic gill symbiont TaxID=1052212 RepID=UPI001BB22F1C